MFTQKNVYASIDLLLGLTEVYSIIPHHPDNMKIMDMVSFKRNGKNQFITYEKPKVTQHDALRLELKNFIQSIKGIETPIVDGEAGKNALELALKIQQMITWLLVMRL